MRAYWRTAAAGLTVALIIGLAGGALGRARFGASDADAVARAAADLDRRLDEAARTLAGATAALAADPGTLALAARDADARRRLFSAAVAALPLAPENGAGLAVYGATGDPIAWAGRVSEFPRAQLDRAPALFIATGPPGPRLVRIDAIAAAGGTGDRAATVVAEFALGPAGSSAALADGFELPTLIGPALIRPTGGAPVPDASPSALVVPIAAAGAPLGTAAVDPSQIDAARTRWRLRTTAVVLAVLALVLLAAAVPLAGWQRRARAARGVLAASAALAAVALGARAVLWFALAPVTRAGGAPGRGPYDLLLTALAAALVAWLLLDLETRRRFARPRPRLLTDRGRAMAVLAPAYLAIGALTAWGLWTYARVLRGLAPGSALDVIHFALHPPNPSRLALAFALLLLHASAVWAAVWVTRLPGLAWRTRREWHMAIGAPAWLAGAAIGFALAGPSIPVPPLAAALAGVAVCRLAIGRPHGRLHRASQAARVFWYSLGLVVPAIALYPLLLAYATDAREALVADTYAPQVVRMREDLQDRLRRALDQIDQIGAREDLGAALPPPAPDGLPDVGPAFAIWQRTDLATYRLTSAVELYDAAGRLASRFALSLPEQATPEYRAASCDWDMVEETSPFGASDRHWLRASRGLCENGRPAGAIVVRVMLDYRRLFFVAPQSPYLESLRAQSPEGADETAGQDIELAIYGWSRTPVDGTGARVWLLPDAVFARLVASRDPFWASLRRDEQVYRVYLQNDRGGIYAIGYPVETTFGHLLNLAELITLALALYVLLLAAATLTGVFGARSGASGRALLHEIRSSFYRKLVLYFGAGAVIPVVILALATRAYLTAQLNAREQESAAQTATVARRLVEDYVALQERNQVALGAVDDQIMVLVSRAIDQDVNLFDGPSLQATSNRALFASGLLTERTPSDVYAGIVLDRQKTFVGVESIGGAPYLLAAEPVRAGAREGIVTVPLTLRQEETERQRDELDRRVLLGAVLFSLMGAGLGYYLAERVADPVNRLTRATRRIARGDLDARIAATSSDEFRRLVEDFNRMAADLQRQRRELERTQRLEAWAEMARQVAHEIKNPLTPIQLSAEHVRRVNQDRGRPLSPALDECVTAILSQVRLLRQIASEFSNFASSPIAKLEPVDVAALIAEVMTPYRAGLSDRVGLHVDADPDLPRVRLDRTLFARALTNIVENALHAMPGGGTLAVTSRQSSVASHGVQVEITDSGVGMDDDAVARIFEPYFSTKATGTGLGLTIAKRNIELNGGTIAVRSTKGVGTTVTIELT